MFRFITIMFFLTGCTVQNTQPVAINSLDSLGHVAVVSTLGDHFDCDNVGVTVFNNKSAVYEPDEKFNAYFSQEVSNSFNKHGVKADAIKRAQLSFVNQNKGASRWENIEIKNHQQLKSAYDSLAVFGGSFRYSSATGYYAKNNALNTFANLYIYDLSSGELLGRSSASHSIHRHFFSCAEETMPSDEFMEEIMNESAIHVKDQIFDSILGQKAPSESKGETDM